MLQPFNIDDDLSLWAKSCADDTTSDHAEEVSVQMVFKEPGIVDGIHVDHITSIEHCIQEEASQFIILVQVHQD